MFDSCGEALADARKACSFTVARMSEITGYSERSIYRYERNLLMPSVEYVMQVSKFCKVSTDQLLGLQN